MNQPLPFADSPRASTGGTPAFEQLLLKLAARFVGADPEIIDDMISDSLRQIVESLGLDRSTLWHIEPDGTAVCDPPATSVRSSFVHRVRASDCDA